MIGDFNLVDSDLCQLFACGVADSLDEPFCAQGPLLPTCRGDRRIDFAISKHMHPTQFNQHEGVADHDCVVYGFDSSPHQCIKGCPKRSPIEVTDAEDIHHRWNHHWCATQFENFTRTKMFKLRGPCCLTKQNVFSALPPGKGALGRKLGLPVLSTPEPSDSSALLSLFTCGAFDVCIGALRKFSAILTMPTFAVLLLLVPAVWKPSSLSLPIYVNAPLTSSLTLLRH